MLIRRLAPLGLMPAAALAVHQLRYWLAFGGRAGALLQAQGHSYLRSLVPWIVLALTVATGAFLRALGRAFAGQRSLRNYTVSFAVLWLLCTGALIVIYISQEFLEGLVASGHPGGLSGIFGYGGWCAVPAALAVGLVLAALFHGARWVLQEVIARQLDHAHAGRPVSAPLPRDAMLPRPAPLAGAGSGRGPPR